MTIEIFSRVKDGSFNNVSHANDNACNIALKYKKKKFNFNINKLWNNNENNDEIFNEINYRSSGYRRIYWVAFGYTGSGKTYTTYALLRNLLEKLTTDEVGSIYITAYQIYKDNIYDMLNRNVPVKIWKTNELIIKDLKKKKINKIEKLFDVLEINRACRSTYMNNVSSRSHAIIDIYVGDIQYTLVDLAGQESGTTCSAAGRLVQTQGTSINLNMLALKECIRTYYMKESHIPFRRSLLTLALKPLFTSKCYVGFISTISLNHNIFNQIDSLRYAAALYDENTDDKTKIYDDLFALYSDYIDSMEKLEYDEQVIWDKMRLGNFDNSRKIQSNLVKRCDLMKNFYSKYKKFEDKLPEIDLNINKK